MKHNTTKNVIKSKTIATSIHKEINELMIKTCRYTKQSMKQKAITNTFDVGNNGQRKYKKKKETIANTNIKRNPPPHAQTETNKADDETESKNNRNRLGRCW